MTGRTRKSPISTGSELFEADNDCTDLLSLHIDRNRVQVGNDITGRVDSIGEKDTKVIVEFEGIEYTVVALPGMSDEDLEGIPVQDLQKETFQKRIFLQERKELESNASEGFRFGIPSNSPGTMRRTLDGTNSSLPSQCQIKYSVTATIIPQDENEGRRLCHESKFSKEIFVLPKKASEVPIDPMIGVSIVSNMEALQQTLFSWGNLRGAVDAVLACSFPSDEPRKDNYIVLEPSAEKLNLCIGQTLQVEVHDSFRLLSRYKNAVWMMKLTEELRWEAKGRKTSNTETWNLHVKNHAIPNLIPSYDHSCDSLIQVHHALVVYMATEEKPAEYVASTGPIKVRIETSRAGWDA